MEPVVWARLCEFAALKTGVIISVVPDYIICLVHSSFDIHDGVLLLQTEAISQ